MRRERLNDADRHLHIAPTIHMTVPHLKGEHRMGRNYLAGQVGDAANAVLAAAGYNFRLKAW
jgi:transposase, IS5 family